MTCRLCVFFSILMQSVRLILIESRFECPLRCQTVPLSNAHLLGVYMCVCMLRMCVYVVWCVESRENCGLRENIQGKQKYKER